MTAYVRRPAIGDASFGSMARTMTALRLSGGTSRGGSFPYHYGT